MWSVDESCRPNYRRFRPPEDTRYDEYTEWTKICDDKNAVIAFICVMFFFMYGSIEDVDLIVIIYF